MTESRRSVRMTVNDEEVELGVPVRRTLAEVLREELGLTGTHIGCEHGVCGACTVRLDGAIVRSCLLLACQADGCRIETIEGLSGRGLVGELQEAFHRRNALQCGYCTPAMLITAADFLEREPTTDRQRIREAISGNYCRCTGYHAIVDAIAEVAAARGRGGGR